MQLTDDSALLRQYVETRSDAAFAALVARHINLVYSVAVRCVGDPHQAQEVAQTVFILLANKAATLRHDKALSSWLFQTTRHTASNFIRSESRRHRRELEAHMQSQTPPPGEDLWTRIAPLLDEAVADLNDTDRRAVLLRFYEGKSLREIGATLETSEDAAQKRLARAVERLREFFAQRGVSVGTSGLVAVLSANAVQAAPVGLAVTIATGATLAGTATVTTTATAIETIAMTTLQKALVAVTVAVAVAAGIYQTRQVSVLRDQVQVLQQTPSLLTDQLRQLQQERDAVIARQATLREENARLQQAVVELPKLRAEVGRLRTRAPQQAQRKSGDLDANDPAVQGFLTARAQAEQISRYLTEMPDKTIPELKLLTEVDWLSATKEAKFDSDADVRRTLAWLRSLAKNRMPMGEALNAFTRANNGQLPTDLAQLKPYFKSALGKTPLDDAGLDAILGRYKLLHAGNLNEFSPDTWFIAEKAPVDKDYDSRAKFGNGRSTVVNTGIGEAGDPDDNSY